MVNKKNNVDLNARISISMKNYKQYTTVCKWFLKNCWAMCML